MLEPDQWHVGFKELLKYGEHRKCIGINELIVLGGAPCQEAGSSKGNE